MASIPHGTVILAQGTAAAASDGPPNIPDSNILPFFFNDPRPTNRDFHAISQTFDELNLSHHTAFRFLPPGVTQDIGKNPNSVLRRALQGKTVKHRTFRHVATTHRII